MISPLILTSCDIVCSFSKVYVLPTKVSNLKSLLYVLLLHPQKLRTTGKAQQQQKMSKAYLKYTCPNIAGDISNINHIITYHHDYKHLAGIRVVRCKVLYKCHRCVRKIWRLYIENCAEATDLTSAPKRRQVWDNFFPFL